MDVDGWVEWPAHYEGGGAGHKTYSIPIFWCKQLVESGGGVVYKMAP
jgi:hypothetical protein